MSRTILTVLTLAAVVALTGCTATTAELPAPAAGEDTVAEAVAPEGTRDNPYPLGSKIIGAEWEVTVNSFTANGNDIVTAANQFNTPPTDGNQYGIVNYTVTYTGKESDYAASVSVAYVTKDGNVVNSYDAMVVLNDGFGMAELYTGASATGSDALLIPVAADGLLRIRPGMLADEVFVAIQ